MGSQTLSLDGLLRFDGLDVNIMPLHMKALACHGAVSRNFRFSEIVLAVGIIFRICLEKRQLVTETALYGDVP